MKRYIIIILLAATIIPAIAATSNDIKLWSEGPLTWADFGRVLPSTSSEPSQLEVELSATPLENENAATVRLEARAIMHRNASATSAAQSTPQRLRYHQLQFDLLELMRRNLQQEINTGIDGAQAEQRLRYYQDLYRQRVREMARDTRNGADMVAVDRWENNVENQLHEIGIPGVPQVTSKLYFYGLYAGVGYDSPTGKLRDNFGGSVIFHVGLTGGYKALRLKADVAFGQPSYRNSNIFNVAPDEQGRPLQGNSSGNATHIMVSAQLGYTVYSHGRLSITPNVGGFYNRYSWDVANYSWSVDDDGHDIRTTTSTEGRNLHCFSAIASIDFDINLSSKVSNTSLTGYGHRERWTSSVRITPWVAHSKFNKCDPAVSGMHVGINVSYLGLARLLRL